MTRTQDERVTQPSPVARAGADRLRPLGRVLAVLSVLSTVALHVYAARDGAGPIFYTDEIGYLSNAQLLAGVGEPRDLSFSSYYLGWSVLLTPVWWLSTDPGTVYRIALGLSVLCAVGLLVPLTLLAERLGAARPWSVVLAAAVACAPARVVPSNFALAENFLTLVLALTVLAALRFEERPTHGRAAVLGLAAAWVFVTHGRMVPVLAAVCLWLGLSVLRRRWSGLTGIAVAVGVSVPMFLLYRWVAAQLYEPTMDREARGLLRLLDVDPVAAVLAGAGQAWYAVVAWFGLTAIGVVAVVVRAVHETRRGRPATATWSVVAFAGAVLISVTWIAAVVARGDDRFDIYSYGRYLDPMLSVLALVGLTVLWRGRRAGTVRVAAVLSALVVAGFLLVVVPRVPITPTTWWGPNSVAGLLQWDWPAITAAQRPPWYPASLACLALLALVALCARRAPWLPVALLVVVVPVSAWVAQTKTLDPFYLAWYSSFELGRAVEQRPGATVAFDVAGTTETEGTGDTVSRNAYQFWLAPRTVEVLDSTVEVPTTDLVVARRDWALAEELGAVRVAEDDGLFDNALWVMPGPRQEELLAPSAPGIEAPDR